MTAKATLKSVTVEHLEAAFGKALSELLDTPYKVTISSVNYAHANQLGSMGIVPIEMFASPSLSGEEDPFKSKP